MAALKAAVDAGATGYTAARSGCTRCARPSPGHAPATRMASTSTRRAWWSPPGASAALLLPCCALVDPGAQVPMADPSTPATAISSAPSTACR
ncbi:MAG: hypothetical protein IPM99_16625 [Rubrivivax sp.]|nr:hypothetical protein [Rubrivivax sp.]